MGLYTPSMLLFWLGDTVTEHQIGRSPVVCTGGIKLLGSPEEPLRSDCLYISEEAPFRSLLANDLFPKEGVFIIVSCPRDAFRGASFPPQLTLMQSELPLIPLYNKVHSCISAFQDWEHSLRAAVHNSLGLQAILEIAASKIHASIMLLNPGFKCMAAVYAPHVNDSTAAELQKNGYLSFDTVQDIKHQAPVRRDPDQNLTEYLSSSTGNYNIVRLIRYQNTLIARLYIALDGPTPMPAYSDLSAIVAECISSYLLSSQSIDYSSNSGFGSLVSDIIECRLTDLDELKQRLRQFNMNIRYSYHIILISFNEATQSTPIPWNYVTNLLLSVFPLSNATVYRGDILLFLRKTKRASHVPFSHEQLLPILEQYDCCAGISNSSDYISSLPPVYHQTRACLRIGYKMHPEKRIYYYEDYSIYHIIELAAEAARTNISSRNFLHLCNNEIVALTKYDQKNDTDLIHTLYAYLTHGCNSTEAAKALYIHRNTMLYKLKRIESVIGCPLNDFRLQERLLFSYHVLEFCKHYHGIDPMELKPIRPEDAPNYQTQK